MKDPLTTEQKETYWLGIREMHNRLYESALRSGALSEKLYQENPSVLMKMVMIILAETQYPLTNDMKKELKNLQHFI